METTSSAYSKMANPTSKYASQLQMLSPLFPDWDEDALASVLADTRGNAEEAAVLITDGQSIVSLQACFEPKS